MSLSFRSACFTSFSVEPPNFGEHIRYMIFQREKCPTSDKLHWQGYAEFNDKFTLKKIKEILGASVHVEARKGTREQARDYCRKEESRVSEPIEFGSWESGGQGARTDLLNLVKKIEDGKSDYELIQECPEDVNKYLKFIQHVRHVVEEEKGKKYMQENYCDVELNENQKIMVDHLEKQNDRKITWVYDEKGGCGKTFLSKHLIASQGAMRFTNASTKDIAYAFKPTKCVIFDFARTTEERINYQVIEDLKNGMLFSPKYESVCKMFEPPKIIIMANFMPKLSALSEDRWDIIEIAEPGNTEPVQL